MGAYLCRLMGSQEAAQDDGADDARIKRKEFQQEEGRVRKIAKVVTLEEWLSSSPIILARRSGTTATRTRTRTKTRTRTNGIEIPVVNQSTTKVMIPWLMNSPLGAEAVADGQEASFFTRARDSFSLEMPRKSTEAGGAHQEAQMTSISPVSTPGRMKKKTVSFRLPEEADIIIFWSPVHDIAGDR